MLDARKMRYYLRARISSDHPDAIEPVLTRMAPQGTVAPSENGQEFVVEGTLDGSSARDLNRSLLSALTQVEKRTRLRAKWMGQGTVERFFDYVPKRARKGLPGGTGSGGCAPGDTSGLCAPPMGSIVSEPRRLARYSACLRQVVVSRSPAWGNDRSPATGPFRRTLK